MLLLVLLISITSQLLLVSGHQWFHPPKEYIDEHPEYGKPMLSKKTKNESEEAESIDNNFPLKSNAEFL